MRCVSNQRCPKKVQNVFCNLTEVSANEIHIYCFLWLINNNSLNDKDILILQSICFQRSAIFSWGRNCRHIVTNATLTVVIAVITVRIPKTLCYLNLDMGISITSMESVHLRRLLYVQRKFVVTSQTGRMDTNVTMYVWFNEFCIFFSSYTSMIPYEGLIIFFNIFCLILSGQFPDFTYCVQKKTTLIGMTLKTQT